MEMTVFLTYLLTCIFLIPQRRPGTSTDKVSMPAPSISESIEMTSQLVSVTEEDDVTVDDVITMSNIIAALSHTPEVASHQGNKLRVRKTKKQVSQIMGVSCVVWILLLNSDFSLFRVFWGVVFMGYRYSKV